jgi:hypothetical protein
MGWSTSAPTLPSGSSWAQVGTTFVETNNLKITSTIYAARLDGNDFAVRVTETRTFYKSYFDQTYHRCDIGGVTGTAYTGSWPANSGDTVSYYFTGEAAAGASITVTVGRQADSTGDMKASTFAAPALLGPTVYIKVGGTWKQASAVYIKVSGAWKEGQLKFKTGGAWK